MEAITPSIFDLKNRDDVRAFLHTTLPGIATFLIAVHALTSTIAPLVVALVLALADALLSGANSIDAKRAGLYAVLGAASALGIGLGLFTDINIAPYLAVIPIILGGSVATGSLAAATPR